ncbi:MAG: hypothetical protein WC091_17255 [Sulfuricellaceae bacterium]
MNTTEKLAAALWEAERHMETLKEALAEWNRSPAATWEALEADRAKVRVVDQLLFRFTKLQDAVGERLVPATLAVLREPFEEWPMRDRLNRLDKLGYLNVADWLAWREIRNRLAHEYPDLPEVRFAALTAAIDAAWSLAALCQDWRNRLKSAELI